jgi:beta-xylosidase
MNPVIPGDHPDCTLTKIGNDFYTTGSSFNPTPVIYHSTDLVHWEAIAQPVNASWSGYGDNAGAGCWGGQLVYRSGKFWHFFFRGTMHFTTASKIEGPWSTPTAMSCPASVPGLGYDNSIFVDDDNKWYLVVKNGQVNNWIVQLGDNGQPSGVILNLCWINPAPTYPYSWAEGPVMWKYKGYYYYSFARDVSGGQKVMRSNTLTADQASWTMLGDLFNLNDPKKPQALFGTPNHSSAPVILNDSTNWVIHPVYYAAGNDWKAQGRQGLLNQLRYDVTSKPLADYPINEPLPAPKLSSNGIPWMVPKSDFFEKTTLNPEWSFSGYTPTTTWSLTLRPGWLKLSPRTNKTNTVVKNDAEHNYTILTRVDFKPLSSSDEAGIRISTAADTIYVKVFTTINSGGQKVISFSYYKTKYEIPNTIGDTIWLKLTRSNHIITGHYSKNGIDWAQVGQSFDITVLDLNTDMKNWSGQRQGLYVLGNQSAFFDLYIYRDAYSNIPADCPANQYGTTRGTNILDNIHNNDWALYAGVEFQNKEYGKIADSVQFIASSYSTGGSVEIWLDSIGTGEKIGTCPIQSTGSWAVYKTFKTKINPVIGRHDVYLKFTGAGSVELFQLKSLQYIIKKAPKYIGSETINDSTISVRLDQAILNPTLPSGFLITLNNIENITISQASLGTNDSMIILILKKKLNPNDSLKISYNTGNVKTSEGLELIPFNDKNVNNLLTKIFNINSPKKIAIIPNPNGGAFEISSDFEFNFISIYDLKGELIYNQTFKNKSSFAKLEIEIPKGLYIIKLEGLYSRTYSKFQIQ